MRAHLLVDGVLNTLIVSNALDVALPQQSGEPEDADSQEITDAQMSSDEDTPARDGMGNPDLDEVAVLYEHLMEGSVPAKGSLPC